MLLPSAKGGLALNLASISAIRLLPHASAGYCLPLLLALRAPVKKQKMCRLEMGYGKSVSA
jgi:hypothetical protein